MELRRKRPIYDLNKLEDRAYLLNRGFVWAVIYPHGQNRGKLISAQLKDSKVDVVRIAEYPDNLS